MQRPKPPELSPLNEYRPSTPSPQFPPSSNSPRISVKTTGLFPRAASALVEPLDRSDTSTFNSPAVLSRVDVPRTDSHMTTNSNSSGLSVRIQEPVNISHNEIWQLPRSATTPIIQDKVPETPPLPPLPPPPPSRSPSKRGPVICVPDGDKQEDVEATGSPKKRSGASFHSPRRITASSTNSTSMQPRAKSSKKIIAKSRSESSMKSKASLERESPTTTTISPVTTRPTNLTTIPNQSSGSVFNSIALDSLPLRPEIETLVYEVDGLLRINKRYAKARTRHIYLMGCLGIVILPAEGIIYRDFPSILPLLVVSCFLWFLMLYWAVRQLINRSVFLIGPEKVCVESKPLPSLVGFLYVDDIPLNSIKLVVLHAKTYPATVDRDGKFVPEEPFQFKVRLYSTQLRRRSICSIKSLFRNKYAVSSQCPSTYLVWETRNGTEADRAEAQYIHERVVSYLKRHGVNPDVVVEPDQSVAERLAEQNL